MNEKNNYFVLHQKPRIITEGEIVNYNSFMSRNGYFGEKRTKIERRVPNCSIRKNSISNLIKIEIR